MCSTTGQREKLLRVYGQIGLHQLGTISVKSLVSLNACARLIYFPPTAKVIQRRSQFIVSSERLDYKSSSLTTRPQRLLSFNVSCSQVSGSGSLSLLLDIKDVNTPPIFSVIIRPFEKRSYYVIPLGVRPSVCKLFRFHVTPPTVYVRLS